MRSFGTCLLSAALLALAACTPPAAPTADAPQAQTADGKPGEASPAPEAAAPDGKPASAQAAPAPTAPVSGPARALSPAALVGRWGDNGDCNKDIFFNADGSFRSYTGGVGRWSLVGDRMTMSGAGGTYEVRVQVINQNQLRIINPDGSVGTSQRC